MALPPPLTRAWFHWQRTPLPVEAARLRRTQDPLHGVEQDLDHLRSYIYSLGMALFEGGQRWDYSGHAGDELEALHRVSVELDELPLPDQAKAPYRVFIAASTTLLREVARLTFLDEAT